MATSLMYLNKGMVTSAVGPFGVEVHERLYAAEEGRTWLTFSSYS